MEVVVDRPLPGARQLSEALEGGDIVHYPVCPFPLPATDDTKFLLEQRLASRAHKNIGYDPHTARVTSFARQGEGQGERLRSVLGNFSHDVTTWLGATLPRYAEGWQLDRMSFRPEQEATRKLRPTARNDLLHVDSFPSRPSNGCRILRVFANVNPSEPRIWITGAPFAQLLARYGAEAGLPDGRGPALWDRLRASCLRLVRPGRPTRSAYDAFMLRFHNFLKANADFQATSQRCRWEFQPGSAWMVLTDTASHAVLSGRYALEHSYFLSPDTLTLPEESPAALLRRACGRDVLAAAA